MKKVINFPYRLLSVVLIVSFFVTCTPSTETKINLNTKATAMGPFFAGPNSLIAEYEVDLASIKGLENVSAKQIKEVKVNSIKLNLAKEEELDFSDIFSASLQIVSGTTGMQSIATKNPIESKGNELVMDVSSEVDLSEYLKDKQFSLVLDLDFAEDSYAEQIGAIIDLDLTVKHK